MSSWTFVTVLLVIGMVSSEREHKVHNIILYPEKHSWCQTTPIQQIVASPGYESTTIDNNVCVGACYSYSIPRTQPAEPGELIGPYCDSCQPIETKCYHVTLHADGKNVDGPKTTQKRVQIIMNCSCMSCEKIQKKDDCEITDQTTLELPLDLFSNRSNNNLQQIKTKIIDDIPELLHFTPSSDHYRTIKNNLNTNLDLKRYQLNTKLISLLKTIQKSNNDDDNDDNDNNGDDSNNYDTNQLNDLLKLIEGTTTTNNQLTDENLINFVNYVNINNNDDFELDLGRLKNVLTKFQKTTNKNFEGKSVSTSSSAGDNIGIEENLIDLNSLKKSSIHRNHHLGDELHVHGLNIGHLVKGPHGSMVLAPDNLKVEEKLNIDSDILKPNHDGVVISYENHHKTNN